MFCRVERGANGITSISSKSELRLMSNNEVPYGGEGICKEAQKTSHYVRINGK